MTKRDELLALAEKARDRITKTPTGCWEWSGARHSKGYGQLWNPYDKKIIGLHRLMFMVANDVTEIAPGMMVCHHCDNPPCCNPSHLFLGDARTNGQDMAAKGRSPWHRDPSVLHRAAVLGGKKVGGKNLYAKGRHPTAVLNLEKARAIRKDPRIARLVAPEYGVSIKTIWEVRRGRYWKDAQP